MTAIKLNTDKLKKDAGVDLDKVNDGVWCDMTTIPGCKMKIAQMGNEAYESYLDKTLRKKYRKQIQRGTLTSETREKYVHEAISRFIITDWQGMPGTDEFGKPCEVPFSRETALQILEDKELMPIKEEIVSYSTDEQNYFLEWKEQAELD